MNVCDKILDLLPNDGSSMGNMYVKDKLSINEEDYFIAKQELLNLGKITMGRGKGGSIKKIVSGKKEALFVKNEKELYPIFKGWIEEKYEDVIGKNIRNKVLTNGKRKNNGLWSNPDFAYIYVKTYIHFKPSLEICSFEIKKNIYDARLGVYEAFAHKNFATRAYLVFQYNESEPELFLTIQEDCRKFGIGIITFDGLSFEIEHEASQHIPDLSKSDEYIELNLNKDEKMQIRI